MASKKRTEDVTDETAGLAPEETAATEVAAGKPITDFCVIVNLTGKQEQYSLTNGRTVTCGPKLKGRTTNRSEAFERKYLSPLLRKLQDAKKLLIDQARPEEVSK